MEKFKFLDKEKISQLPKTSGVYCFKRNKPARNASHSDAGGEILYIGKALNIKERIKQHQDLISVAEKIGYIKTDSEITAFLLEAKLIKKYKPKRNVMWRDDKNYFYVGIGDEDFPRVFITHQIQNTKYKIQDTKYVGPFVDGSALKQTLKTLRKVFPYRSCNKIPKHACLWYQLGRCLAPCTSKR